MAGSVWQMTPSTPHRGRKMPLKLATQTGRVIPQKTRSHPKATTRSSPSPCRSQRQRVTRRKSRRRASRVDARPAGSRGHRPHPWQPHTLLRQPGARRGAPLAIDCPRLRSPLPQHRSAHSRSHRPRTTRSRVTPRHRMRQWCRCHLVCRRTGGILPVEDIPMRLPHS